MKQLSISIPSVSGKAEFPLIFLLIFLPAYLSQAPLPAGIFDNSLYQGQVILHSLLIFFLIRYLLEQRSPAGIESFQSAFAPALNPLHALLTLAALGGLYALYALGLMPLLYNTVLKGDAAGTLQEQIYLTRPGMLPGALVSCLAAAAMEEFFFRGYAFFRLRESGLGPLNALLCTGILFAAGHLYEGIPAALFALSSGLVLNLLVLRGWSLFSLTAGHGMFNFLMILLSYLRQLPSS